MPVVCSSDFQEHQLVPPDTIIASARPLHCHVLIPYVLSAKVALRPYCHLSMSSSEKTVFLLSDPIYINLLVSA